MNLQGMAEFDTTRKIGQLGEQVAAVFLMKHGFSIIQRNYWKKWGEIDLIAEKAGVIHFVEVKSTTYKTRQLLSYAVTHGTWRPEEQVHQFKLHQIARAAETWINETSFVGEWRIDVAAVRIVPRETFATVNIIENITG